MGVRKRAVSQWKLAVLTRCIEDGEWRMIQPEAVSCLMFLQCFSHFQQCTSYQGSRQILSRRQYAPNKLCALNNDVRLITRFYGIRNDMLFYYYTTSGNVVTVANQNGKDSAGMVATLRLTHKYVFYCGDGVFVCFKGPVHHSDVSRLKAAWNIGGVGAQTVHQILHI